MLAAVLMSVTDEANQAGQGAAPVDSILVWMAENSKES